MQQFRMIRRNSGVYYTVDRDSRVQASLKTKDHDEAVRLLAAKNNAAQQQPSLNLHIARAYLAAADPKMLSRTWNDALQEIIRLKTGPTRLRWERAANDKAFAIIKPLAILETRAEHFMRVLSNGKVATNAFLRKLHNFALDSGFLPWPILPKKQWPKIKYKEKRAIAWDEHLKIIDREGNPEIKAFYELLWHLGGSQSDVANLTAEDIDWGDRIIAFRRKKTGTPSLIRLGPLIEDVLRRLPKKGLLFPRLCRLRESRRSDYFRRRCESVAVHGVTLHSYRYAMAERLRTNGVSERAAMEILGHQSKAVARSYAKKARIVSDLETTGNTLNPRNQRKISILSAA
jgi:integrase